MNKIIVILIIIITSFITWWVLWYYKKNDVNPISNQLDLKSWNTKINWVVSSRSYCDTSWWSCQNYDSDSWWSSWWGSSWGWGK